MNRLTCLLWVACALVSGCGGPEEEETGASALASALGSPTLFTPALPFRSQGALVAEPERIDFLAAPGIHHLQDVIVLRPASAAPVRILSLTLRDDPKASPGGAAHFAYDEPALGFLHPGEKVELTVRYLAGGGQVRAIIEVTTDSASGEPLRIHLSGLTVRPPVIPWAWQRLVQPER